MRYPLCSRRNTESLRGSSFGKRNNIFTYFAKGGEEHVELWRACVMEFLSEVTGVDCSDVRESSVSVNRLLCQKGNAAGRRKCGTVDRLPQVWYSGPTC